MTDTDPWLPFLSPPAPKGDEGFDAFISYKSENVAFARRIADRLIASGLKIWFAEYQIRLEGRDRFQQEVDRGIAHSRRGIAITNDLYAGSGCCRNEMAQLLRHCGPGHIIDIRFPAEPETRRIFPALAGALAIDCAADPEAAFGFVTGVTGWQIAAAAEPVGAPTPRFHRGDCLGIGYAIDVTGWTLVDPSFHGGGPCYGLGKPPLLWNLQYGPADDLAEIETRRRWGQPGADDRRLLRETCEYALRYFSMVLPASDHGVHVIFAGGMGQFAVTYRRDRFWKRRYSVMLTDPGSKKSAEFVFTFQFDGDFREYCRHAEIMDMVVASLRWDPSLPRPRRPRPIPAMRAVVMEAQAGSPRARKWLVRVYLAIPAGGLLGGALAHYQNPYWPRTIALALMTGVVFAETARRFLPSPFMREGDSLESQLNRFGRGGGGWGVNERAAHYLATKRREEARAYVKSWLVGGLVWLVSGLAAGLPVYYFLAERWWEAVVIGIAYGFAGVWAVNRIQRFLRLIDPDDE